MGQQRTIRFSEKLAKEMEQASRQRGFANPTAFIRFAVEQELSARQDGFIGAEERLAGSIEQVRRDLLRSTRAQQALFAYLDTLAKTLLTCIPEPPAEARSQAIARAKERYDRLVKAAGQAMAGDSRAAMLALVAHVEG